MPCPLCIHPRVQEIEERLLKESNLPEMAIEFCTTRPLLKRHQACMRSAFREVASSRSIEIGDVVMNEVLRLLGMSDAMTTRAAKIKNDDLKLRSMDFSKRCLDLVCKLTGQFNPEHKSEAAQPTLTYQQICQVLQSAQSKTKQ